jgi:hypothetical protein
MFVILMLALMRLYSKCETNKQLNAGGEEQPAIDAQHLQFSAQINCSVRSKSPRSV